MCVSFARRSALAVVIVSLVCGAAEGRAVRRERARGSVEVVPIDSPVALQVELRRARDVNVALRGAGSQDYLSEKSQEMMRRYASVLRAYVRLSSRGDSLTPYVGSFSELWREGAQALLTLGADDDRLWDESCVPRGGMACLAGAVLSFCSPKFFEDDEVRTPLRLVPPEMASVADSILTCCVPEATCRTLGGRSCREVLYQHLAHNPDLDVISGFRYSTEFWSIEAPAVSREVVEMMGEMLRKHAYRIVSLVTTANTGSVGVLSSDEAREMLRPVLAASGIENVNLLASVPGFREPRVDEAGRLVGTIVMPYRCLALLGSSWEERLRSELEPRWVLRFE